MKNRKKNGRYQSLLVILILILGTILLAACQTEADAPVETPTPDPVATMQAALQATAAASEEDRSGELARWSKELDAAETLWAASNVSKYALTVLYVNSGQQILQSHTITVENGAIIEQSAACSEQQKECIINKIDLENITVPGLFGMARNAINNDEVSDNGAEFNFDPHYGVPEWIVLKTNGDFPWYWHVESFEVLE